VKLNLLVLRKKLLQNRWLSKSFSGSIIRFTPALLKYGNAYVATKAAIRKARRSLSYVEDWRNKRLAKVLQETSNTEWGKSLGLGLILEKTKDPMEVLSKLPAMRAVAVSDNPNQYLTSDLRKFDFCSTSGTSGKPKIFYLGIERGPIETAFVHDSWRSSGFGHQSKRAVFRGITLEGSYSPLLSWRPELQELQISPFSLTYANLEIIWKEIFTRRIKYLHGYPSALEILASWLRDNPSALNEAKSIKGVLPISETTFPHQTYLFKSIFTNAKIVSFYGLSEKVAFANMDESNPTVYHFSPIYGITELLGEDLTPIEEEGQEGFLFSTGLLYSGTRFVRYETGDQAELVSTPTRENGFVLSVKNVKSRWTVKPAIGKKGEIISITALNLHQPVMLYFSQMQYLQRNPGELQLSVIPNKLSTSSNLEKLRTQVQNLVGEALDVTLEIVDSLEQNSRGKIQLLVVKSD
jgi:phenylacetate-CoA ligase